MTNLLVKYNNRIMALLRQEHMPLNGYEIDTLRDLKNNIRNRYLTIPMMCFVDGLRGRMKEASKKSVVSLKNG